MKRDFWIGVFSSMLAHVLVGAFIFVALRGTSRVPVVPRPLPRRRR